MTTFDTKIKIILRNGLEPWQELNVTAFLVSGIAGTQAIIGEPYIDADGVQYLPMSQTAREQCHSNTAFPCATAPTDQFHGNQNPWLPLGSPH